MIHDMNSQTDYRRLASHHRGLYFVTPTREEVRPLIVASFIHIHLHGMCPHRTEPATKHCQP